MIIVKMYIIVDITHLGWSAGGLTDLGSSY